MTIKDFRDAHRLPYNPKRYKLDKRGLPVKRKPSTIDAVVLHQSACIFGPANNVEARHRRAMEIPYHALCFTDGVTVLGHPFADYCYHSNGLNARGLGFSVEGEFPAFIGKETSRSTPYTELQADGARRGLKAVVEMARAEGCPVEFLFAHRQSSINRAGDPGEYWFKLLSRFARDELGLTVLSDHRVGDGQPIPLAWL
jgi:hypothetical protein